MRRKDREVKELAEIKKIASDCKVVRIAMFDGEYPYILPVNFGCEWQDTRLILYLHGARVGKKIDLLTKNPHVAIEMDTDHELVVGDLRPDTFSYRYRSLLGQGVAEILSDPAEKEHGLKILMDHQTTAPYGEMTTAMIARTAVIKITLETYSAKQHVAKKA